MNRNWMIVFIASFFEVIWVIGLKHATSVWEWIVTAIAILISFMCIIAASAKLPVGTVYAVFVGMGTTGTILADILFFGEPVNFMKLLLVSTLLIGVMGLKLVTNEVKVEEE